jgi:hypothetical protein
MSDEAVSDEVVMVIDAEECRARIRSARDRSFEVESRIVVPWALEVRVLEGPLQAIGPGCAEARHLGRTPGVEFARPARPAREGVFAGIGSTK